MSTKRTNGLTRWQIDGAGALVLGVLSLAAYYTIVEPIARTRLTLADLRSDVRETRSQADELRTVESRINTELVRVQEEINASPVRLEPSNRLNRRLARVVQLAAESGLTIHETRSGDVVMGARFDLVPIEVSGGGSYPACGEFLHRLCADLPDVEVLGFELSGQPGNPGTKAAFRFDLSWYAAPSVAAAPQAREDDSP